MKAEDLIRRGERKKSTRKKQKKTSAQIANSKKHMNSRRKSSGTPEHKAPNTCKLKALYDGRNQTKSACDRRKSIIYLVNDRPRYISICQINTGHL